MWTTLALGTGAAFAGGAFRAHDGMLSSSFSCKLASLNSVDRPDKGIPGLVLRTVFFGKGSGAGQTSLSYGADVWSLSSSNEETLLLEKVSERLDRSYARQLAERHWNGEYPFKLHYLEARYFQTDVFYDLQLCSEFLSSFRPPFTKRRVLNCSGMTASANWVKKAMISFWENCIVHMYAL